MIDTTIPIRVRSTGGDTEDRRGLPSASGIERIVLCPGSWRLERDRRDEDAPTRSALDGTIMHEVLAGIRGEEGLSDKHLWVVRRCRQMVLDLEVRLGYSAPHPDRREIVEERFWYYDGNERELYSGQMDYAVVLGRRGLIVDYKTGGGPVTPTSSNYQMRASAVLLAHNFELDEVDVAIVQPLSDEESSVVRYGRSELIKAEVEILVALRLADEEYAPRRPGPKQCRFCRARGSCPDVRDEVLSLVPAATGMPYDDVLTAGDRVSLVPRLDGAELAELLPRLEIVERVAREIRRQARDRLESEPESVEGYRLREAAERRSVVDVDEAFRRLSGILTPEQFASCCTVNIGRLEETVRLITGRTTAATRMLVDDLLDGAIERRGAERVIERVRE